MNWKVVIALAVAFVSVALVTWFRSMQHSTDLAETLAWMDQTYNPHEGGDNLGQGYGWETHYLRKGQIEEVTEEFKTTFTRLDRCSIAINSETLPRGIFIDVPSIHKYTINLCDIDPESITIKKYDLHKDVFSCADPEQVKLYELNCDNAEIEFRTRNGVTSIKEEDIRTFAKLTGADHQSKAETMTNKCWLLANNVTYAERLAKAFKHAVELCGGKPSKF